MTTGLDLHLDLRLAPARPARSLESALRAALDDGRLSPGTRLPPARTLAADLGISRNTVAGVYGQLAAEGWLEARVGAGTWVAERTSPSRAPGTPAPRSSRPSIDLRGGIPDASGFPLRAWVSAVRAAAGEATRADLAYPDPAGVPHLRAALAGYLARTRGTTAGPEQVVVGHGFADLLGIACRALRDRGVRRVAVESYGHAHHRRVIAAAGLDVVPVAVDADGAVVDALETADVGAVLLTPAHQFPVGVPMAAERRRRLVAWARRTGAVVLEDDYDGEFRYDRRAVGALQALAPDSVLYLGSASKALSPAVGLGWAVVPPAFLPDVVEQRTLAGGPSGLHQLAFARFVEAHEYDRSVRRLRGEYRSRRRRVEQVVADRLPGCEVWGVAAGLQCLVVLPPGTSEERVEAEATRHGLRVLGLGRYLAAGGEALPRPGIVVGYGAPSSHQLEPALELLVRCASSAL